MFVRTCMCLWEGVACRGVGGHSKYCWVVGAHSVTQKIFCSLRLSLTWPKADGGFVSFWEGDINKACFVFFRNTFLLNTLTTCTESMQYLHLLQSKPGNDYTFITLHSDHDSVLLNGWKLKKAPLIQHSMDFTFLLFTCLSASPSMQGFFFSAWCASLDLCETNLSAVTSLPLSGGVSRCLWLSHMLLHRNVNERRRLTLNIYMGEKKIIFLSVMTEKTILSSTAGGFCNKQREKSLCIKYRIFYVVRTIWVACLSCAITNPFRATT